MRQVFVVLMGLVVSGQVASAQLDDDEFDAAADQATLLNGISEIGFPGVPGEIVVFGPRAFALAIARAGERPAAVIAAARYRRGRIVLVGHAGFLTTSETGQTRQFLGNAILWASNKRMNRIRELRVGVHGVDGLVAALNQAGIPAKELDGANWTRGLASCTTAIVNVWDESPQTCSALEKFVRDGGGLLLGSINWVWETQHAKPGQTLRDDCPVNRICMPMGLGFGSEMVSNPAGTSLLAITTDGLEGLHAVVQLERLESLLGDPQQNTPDILNLALAVHATTKALPVDASISLTVRDLAARFRDQIPVVSPENRLDGAAYRKKALATLNCTAALFTPPEQLQPAVGADFFPGPVPADADRVQGQKVAVRLSVHGMHCTGLYAAPGEAVSVEIPQRAASLGLEVQIGAHSDRTFHQQQWERSPEVVRYFTLKKNTTVVGSGFGGLIYIRVPDRPDLHGAPIELEVTGAVRAPLFVLGETDPGDWRLDIREFPAPWGELACDHVILTVRREELQTLDFPDKLMEYWTQVLEAYADLAGIPHARRRPERIVPDYQISTGQLHAGYPIMCWGLPEYSKRLVDLPVLSTQGDWGFYHELGHNHQHGDWTFDGTIEVTCNVFALYLYDTLHPDSRNHEHADFAQNGEQEARYINNGRRFDQWKSEPFLALVMYQQLAEAFGWDAYKKVFAEYRALPDDQRPKTDDEKRDQWMVRFSRAVGRNLGPFFDHWGVPVSDTARTAVRDLPAWMP